MAADPAREQAIQPWPAPFSLVGRRAYRRANRREDRHKDELRAAVEAMVARGELGAINLLKGRSYYLPLQEMEDRLW